MVAKVPDCLEKRATNGADIGEGMRERNMVIAGT
jgi:hypothetical protein